MKIPTGPPAPRAAGEQDPDEDEIRRQEDDLVDEVDEVMDTG